MQRPSWTQKLTDNVDLPGEPLPRVPVIEIAGDSRVLIECHDSITKYGADEICVRVKYGDVIICGEKMELTKMTKEQLVISGKINGVTIQRRPQ